MHLIDPKVEVIKEKDPFKKIEKIGRTCYKSEKNITDESALTFYKNLVEHQHTAILEHATFIFEIKDGLLFNFLTKYKYLNCTSHHHQGTERFLVSGNLRAINETGDAVLLRALSKVNPDLVYKDFLPVTSYDHSIKVVDFYDIPFKTNEEIKKHSYTTMRFTCDRGVSHEVVRHRPFSFAQESTRYVNYSKDRFGGGDIAFIKPAEYDKWDDFSKVAFENALKEAESWYNKLTEFGRTAQEARAVLPNAVKTELIVTGNDEEWQHFFDLRSRGTTGAPHPDMKKIADMALKLY